MWSKLNLVKIISFFKSVLLICLHVTSCCRNIHVDNDLVPTTWPNCVNSQMVKLSASGTFEFTQSSI